MAEKLLSVSQILNIRSRLLNKEAVSTQEIDDICELALEALEQNMKELDRLRLTESFNSSSG